MKINLQKISQMLVVAGLLAFGAVFSAQAQPRTIPPARIAVSSNVIFKERAFPVRISPTEFNSVLSATGVTGTGLLKLSGTLTTVTGACARVEMTFLRIASPVPSVFKKQTFEICGSQAINFSDNLSASEDDAAFIVKAENIDPWNKTKVSGDLTLRYPTADRILTGQPSFLFDLGEGLEANRQFTLNPNTPGKLKVKVTYQGNATVRVTLKRPVSGSTAGASFNGNSGLEFTYDIQPGDITPGNIWTVNVLNTTQTAGNVVAGNIDVKVTYTVEQ